MRFLIREAGALVRVALISCFVPACPALAQVANSPLTFEVASVKPVNPSGPFVVGVPHGGPGSSDPGRFTALNMPLLALITRAYEVPDYRVAGPQWLSQARFEISAKVPSGATEADFHAMLRNLLIERFKLVTHKETRQMQVYALARAKGALKIKESPQCADSDENELQLKFDGSQHHLQTARITMAGLAAFLSEEIKQTVIDATGLSACYGLTLDFGQTQLTVPAGAEATLPADAGPGLFTALQEQLGLKLEPSKAPVEMIVVDSATRTPAQD